MSAQLEPVARCADSAQTRVALDKCLDAYADRVLAAGVPRFVSTFAQMEDAPPQAPWEIKAYGLISLVFAVAAVVIFWRLVREEAADKRP